MNKNRKSVMFLGFIFIMVIGMLFIYSSFQNDKSMHTQQAQVLQPDQMLSGVKQFITVTTSNMKPVPPIP